MANILIADDDKFFRRLIATYLVGIGHKTIEAASGREAIAIISNQPVDLMLIDYMMPQGDGLSIIRHVRQSVLTRNIPMIMITARLSGDDKVCAFDIGVDDYIVKPIHFGELTSRINRLLLLWEKVA